MVVLSSLDERRVDGKSRSPDDRDYIYGINIFNNLSLKL